MNSNSTPIRLQFPEITRCGTTELPVKQRVGCFLLIPAHSQPIPGVLKRHNPILHHVIARMGMAEEQGFGLQKSLRREAKRLALPLPRFAMELDRV